MPYSDSHHLLKPVRQTRPVVFCSPHSGRSYPKEFVEQAQLTNLQLRSSEDAFVNELFARVTEFGAPLLAAKFPRAYLDVNRREDEFDPALIEDVSGSKSSPRALSGLGVIPRVVAHNKVIRAGKISRQEAEARIANFYRPYHQKLAQVLEQTHRQFGWVLMVDCHSMPTVATDRMVVKGGGKPDIVIGTRYGASCSPEIVEQIEAACLKLGLSTAVNIPFAGAYSLQKYGHPSQGYHAVQIEIDRSLYMDEETIQKHEGYWGMRQKITDLSLAICEIEPPARQMAAE